MMIHRDKWGQRLFRASCPIKSFGCLRRKSRWTVKHRINKVCYSCAQVKYRSLEDVQKQHSNVLNIRRVKKRNQYVLWILVKCPTKSVSCTSPNPRWVVFRRSANNILGRCLSCSRSKGGHINERGYREYGVGGKSILEHRLVMSQMLGRRLRKGETVHHKNGKRADNRKMNLELRMGGNHPRGWSLRQMREYLKTVPKRLGGLK